MIRAALAILAVLFLSSPALAQVWSDTNRWTAAWEQRYSQWVRQSWHAGFFSSKTLPDGRANPYYGLRADCADTVYSMRIVFAAENGLPFAMQDPTSSGRTITNRMTRFNDTPAGGARVRKFLAYMYNIVSTSSLPNDTYPIALSRSTVRPGTLILTTKTNHHSWTVKDILPIGVPWLVFNSTIGAGSGPGLQQRKSWPNPHWVFEGNHTPSGNAGFRDWRPLEYLGRPVWEVPGYSEEQYRISLGKWMKTAQTRLATTRESDTQLLTRLVANACEEITGRVQAVREGVAYLASNPGRCMSYATYDTYSTPSRDQRSFDALATLRGAYREILARNGGAEIPAAQQRQLRKIFPMATSTAQAETQAMRPQTVNADSLCVLSYASGKSIDLAEAKRRFFAGLMSNNPHDGLAYRWGEARGPSALARQCEAWDSWSPDLRTAN